MLNTETLVGRDLESSRIQACLEAGRNILLEGPVGVGKTHLAVSAARALGRPVFRIDGDSRYTEQKLTGWFDPPAVLKKGYVEETFIPGALVSAMKSGGVLLINELNRLPEGVQNVLLPAIDERILAIPYLRTISADSKFVVIATQNPKEFVATSHLSEAILDRFELLLLGYQSEEEETQIVLGHAGGGSRQIPELAVRLARATRADLRFRRGASVRAAISQTQIAAQLIKSGEALVSAFVEAAVLAYPNRIEIERESLSQKTASEEIEAIVRELAEKALAGLGGDGNSKKKPK